MLFFKIDYKTSKYVEKINKRKYGKMFTVNIYNEGSGVMFIFFCMVFVFQIFCNKHAFLL